MTLDTNTQTPDVDVSPGDEIDEDTIRVVRADHHRQAHAAREDRAVRQRAAAGGTAGPKIRTSAAKIAA